MEKLEPHQVIKAIEDRQGIFKSVLSTSFVVFGLGTIFVRIYRVSTKFYMEIVEVNRVTRDTKIFIYLMSKFDVTKLMKKPSTQTKIFVEKFLKSIHKRIPHYHEK